MKYCNKCGQLTENCKCSSQKTNTTKNNNKNKKLIPIAILIALLLIGGFFFAKSQVMSKDEVFKTFNSAITTNNAEELEKVLYSKDSRLQINKENCTILLDYFKNNPSALDSVNDNLNNLDSNAPLSLEKVSNEYLFFSKYRVVVKPSYVDIKTSFPKIQVMINNKTYSDFDKTSEIGPLMPGTYKLTANTNTKYLNTTEDKTLNLFKENKIELNLFENLKTINITSDRPDAEVYINNVNTGKKVKDCSNFGPVSYDSKIVGVVKEGTKKLVTEPTSIIDNSAYLDFKNVKLMEDDFKQRLFSFVKGYSQDFAYSVNNNSFQTISGYLEYGSQIYSEQEKVVPQIYNENIRERFDSIDFLNYTYDKEKNEGTIICNEVYGITRGVNPTKVESFKNKYTFKVDANGEFLLTKIEDV